MGAHCRRSLRIRCHSAPKEAIHRKGEMVNDQERKRQIREIYERQIDRAYRIAMIYTGDPHDAEDVAESVFLTMIEKKITFENEEHEKAWFITSVRNRCKDLHKSSWHGKVQLIAPSEVNSEEDQREAVYLCYYEGYTVKETAAIMGLKETKVRSELTAAKRMLRRKRDE